MIAVRAVFSVTDGGDNRNGAGEDSAAEALIIKGCEVSDRTAAARENDDIYSGLILEPS
jgi:hypothetical protein